jgi:hypothetical protein
MKPTNDPFEEHTMMRDGRYTPVEPQENHMEHIMVHTEELQGPTILLWPPERTQLLQQHIMEHQQMMQRMLMASQGMKDVGSQTDQTGGEDGGESEPGAETAQKGGAAISGGQPDVSVAPGQAQGTAAKQASGAAGGRV